MWATRGAAGVGYSEQRARETEDGAEDEFSALRAADKEERLRAQTARLALAQRLLMRVLDLSPGYAAATSSYNCLLDTLKIENPLEFEALLARDLRRPLVMERVLDINSGLKVPKFEKSSAQKMLCVGGVLA